jgi:hypothetical protein
VAGQIFLLVVYFSPVKQTITFINRNYRNLTCEKSFQPQTYFMNIEKPSLIISTVCAIIATVASLRSCQISADVAQDDRQLKKVTELVETQQTQLSTQREELMQMKQQTGLTNNEYKEIKNVDSGTAIQTAEIANQLEISRRELAQANRLRHLAAVADSNSFAINFYRVGAMYTHLFQNTTNPDDVDADTKIEFLKSIKVIVESQLASNSYLLQDQNLEEEWAQFANETEQCIYFQNAAALNHPITEQQEREKKNWFNNRFLGAFKKFEVATRAKLSKDNKVLYLPDILRN